MPSPTSIIQKKMRACEDLAARCANEQPSVTNQPALIIRPLSRRRFIGRIGGAAAAAWTASAISLSPVLGSKSVKAEAATILGRQRAIEAYDLRRDAALAEYHLPIVSHPSNGDEDLYSNKIGNYSKGLPHNNIGEVDLTAYNSYLAAIRSGLPSDFENISLGGNTKLTDPQCGLAFALEGVDSGNSFEPPCPAVASQERADEAVENYWMALLRDVPFTDYATNATALQACAELTSLSGFQGPRINGQVTPQTLFRGFTTGDIVGPYISQFLLQPVYLGALPMAQLYTTYATGLDYMTDASSWLAVQNGSVRFETSPTLNCGTCTTVGVSALSSTWIFCSRRISWDCSGCSETRTLMWAIRTTRPKPRSVSAPSEVHISLACWRKSPDTRCGRNGSRSFGSI